MFRSSLVVVLGALFALHCSSDPAGSSGGSSVHDAFTTRYCSQAKLCCVKFGGLTDATCKSTLSASFLDFTAAEGDACLAAIAANASGKYGCSMGIFLSDVPACARISGLGGGARRSTIAVGGECNDAVTGNECIPPADGHVACVFGDGKMLCQHTSLATEGQPCVGDSNDDGSLRTGVSLDTPVQAEGAYCNRAAGLTCGTGATCIKRVAIGQPCRGGYGDCATGAYCDASTCKALTADGAACVGPTVCASGNCDNASHTCSADASDFFKGTYCK